MAKVDDVNGVWRTVGGRRIFIKDGQDLASAMKESGKFKNLKNEDYQKQEQIVHEAKNEVDRLKRQLSLLEDDDTYGSPDYDDTKYALRDAEDRYREEKAKYDKMVSKSSNEGVKTLSGDYEKDSKGRIVSQKEYDEFREVYKKGLISKEDYRNDNYDALKEIKKTTYKEDLPHKTEIKSQGTSNRKEVSENIQAHILEHYDNPQDFIDQMDAMDYLPTKWRAGEELAKGGSYLIYNEDMQDFLNELKINPKGKKFSDDKAFSMYTSLIGRESEKLYNRLQKNAFQKYLKEHPGSKMSFEDFKDMRK